MGFLNKNAVAARQLPVLAHQRIFAVSAYLHGIIKEKQFPITPLEGGIAHVPFSPDPRHHGPAYG